MSTTLRERPVVPGDVVIVRGRRVGEGSRLGEVLEVLGGSDHPHYAIRWEDGHRTILYPGKTSAIAMRSRHVDAGAERDVAAATQLLIATLQDNGLQFELLHHRRTTSAAAEARVLGVLPQTVAKTLIAGDPEGGCIRAVVPASAHLSTTKLATAVDAESVELLSEADLVRAYPQFELGAVPPFGGPGGDRVVIERRLARCGHVVFDGGVHDMSLRMRTTDLIAVAQARVADISAD